MSRFVSVCLAGFCVLVIAACGTSGSPPAAQSKPSRPAGQVVSRSANETTQLATQDHAQLLRWAACMRHSGYPRVPDPKVGIPQPMGGRGGAVIGWGAAYLDRKSVV